MASTPGRLLRDTEDADLSTAVRAVAAALRVSVGAGPVFVATTDPTTGAFATTFTFDIPDEVTGRFFANEMGGHDVVPFRRLAGAPRPIGSLYASTDRRPMASARWRDIIDPLGWGDELRAAVRAGGATWGYLCLHREAGERPFGEKDESRLAALLPAVAGVLRRVIVNDRGDSGGGGSGVVLVGPRGELAGTSGAAVSWIDELGPRLSTGLPIPLAALAHEVARSGRPAATVTTTRTGRRVLLDAAPLDRSVPPQVIVILGPAPAPRSLRHVALAAALTTREDQVVAAVLEGRSTREIAAELGISQGTVQAHLTSVFGKTGARSRRELLRRLGGAGPAAAPAGTAGTDPADLRL